MKHIFETANCASYELLKQNARHNRSNPTGAERIMWEYLCDGLSGFKFRRQHIIGDYIADFVCLGKMLIIEIDGGYHSVQSQQALDEHRTQWLNSQGYKVIRFTNEQVFQDIEMVLKEIEIELF